MSGIDNQQLRRVNATRSAKAWLLLQLLRADDDDTAAVLCW